jgi:hypothetical protein
MNMPLIFKKLQYILFVLLLTLAPTLFAEEYRKVLNGEADTVSIKMLGKKLEVGDVVFIQVTPYPFKKVASTTHSWVNHVGIIVDTSGDFPIIAESTFPFSKKTPINRFIARSGDGRVAVSRLDKGVSQEDKQRIVKASNKRLGIFYDTGFNLHSKGEFCSRFVREILAESTGASVGEVETFKRLLDKNPDADLAFWRVWYFGTIPWNRETVTPASLYRSTNLKIVFDGIAI